MISICQEIIFEEDVILFPIMIFNLLIFIEYLSSFFTRQIMYCFSLLCMLPNNIPPQSFHFWNCVCVANLMKNSAANFCCIEIYNICIKNKSYFNHFPHKQRRWCESFAAYLQAKETLLLWNIKLHAHTIILFIPICLWCFSFKDIFFYTLFPLFFCCYCSFLYFFFLLLFRILFIFFSLLFHFFLCSWMCIYSLNKSNIPVN